MKVQKAPEIHRIEIDADLEDVPSTPPMRAIPSVTVQDRALEAAKAEIASLRIQLAVSQSAATTKTKSSQEQKRSCQEAAQSEKAVVAEDMEEDELPFRKPRSTVQLETEASQRGTLIFFRRDNCQESRAGETSPFDLTSRFGVIQTLRFIFLTQGIFHKKPPGRFHQIAQ